jgi:hypothetical protein
VNVSEGAPIRESSLSQDLLNAGRYYLGGRRGFLILAGAVLAGGLALNWSWLVAAGIAPLLLTALPCVAMCALGLCMNGTGNRSCSGTPENASGTKSDPMPDEPSPLPAQMPPNVRLEHPAQGSIDTVIAIPRGQPQHSDERSSTDA